MIGATQQELLANLRFGPRSTATLRRLSITTSDPMTTDRVHSAMRRAENRLLVRRVNINNEVQWELTSMGHDELRWAQA